MQEKDLWKLLVGILIGLALLAHVFFPRYEWRAIQGQGTVTVMVYDRWSGRFQRATYTDQGALNVMSVYTPF